MNNSSSPFFETAKGYEYSNPVESLKATLEKTSIVHLPVEIDTEYYQKQIGFAEKSKTRSQCLTVQCRFVNEPIGSIYTHQNSKDIARHPVLATGVAVIDHLKNTGHDVTLSRLEADIPYPTLQIDLIGFFLVAELYRVFLGDFLADIEKAVLQVNGTKGSITMGRRLIAQTPKVGGITDQTLLMPWYAEIDGLVFRIAISFIDTCAVQGMTGYKEFCSNSGVTLNYKDTFTKEEKSRMDEMYVNRSEEFDNYALGDLYNHSALLGNIEKMKVVYDSLDLTEYIEQPRLTIGATVSRIVRSSLLKFLELSANDTKQIKNLCQYGTSKQIQTYTSTTAIYNAKVDGGRCRNNRPKVSSINKLIADIDISGCYGNGLKNQDYPMGRPLIIDYPIKSEQNDYLTLEKFLKKYGDELVPGLWQARVSLKPGYTLKYNQDFLISWIPPKHVNKMPSDESMLGDDWYDVDNIGLTKIFTNDVQLSLITADFIEWLDKTASKRQRAELMKNLVVVTAMFYPAKERCDTVKDFFSAIENHNGKNTTKVDIAKRKSKKTSVEAECHAWLSVNMGDLLVTTLLKERGKYSKKNEAEKPLNTLYKLIINTIYGDMVSPYFDISNVVVGNNITARARAMAWYMEKGLNGFQTITDGCAFELNKVVFHRKEHLTSETLTDDMTTIEGKNLKLKPVGGYNLINHIETKDGLALILVKDDIAKELDNYQSKEWLATISKEHLKMIFPGVTVIDKFDFEIKDIYDKAAFHGTANYKFVKGSESESCKFRSYSKNKDYTAYQLVGDELQAIKSGYQPNEEFFNDLMNNSTKVERRHPYVSNKVLKVNEFRNHYGARYSKTGLFPGCTVESARLMRECSLTQFTFKSFKQFQSWEREAKRLRDTTEQTYEQFFLNPDGTLSYQTMIETLYAKITSGSTRFTTNTSLAENRNLRRVYSEHPAKATLTAMKREIGIADGYYGADESNLSMTLEDDETRTDLDDWTETD